MVNSALGDQLREQCSRGHSGWDSMAEDSELWARLSGICESSHGNS